ncbi:MAG: choice-of-anchor tandem repeat GloVer-containing protein [Thermosynechococcaceae cyanobacterium]
MQAKDGNFYSTTFGGCIGGGTLFKMTLSGRLTKLADFRRPIPPNFDNGEYPNSELIQSKNGALYGTTFWGGKSGLGTVFKVALP